MTEIQRLMAMAALAYGLAYCALVGAAAIVAHNRLALTAILLTLACAFFAFVYQVTGVDRRLAKALVFVSWVTAACAGLSISGV